MLKISQIVLDNFCQHEHLDISFSAGLTGVFGRNGVGKSNIANGTFAALTGMFNRHPDGAAGCIRQGHDAGYVEVHGELQGQTFRLRRDIFPTRIKHTLWLDNEKYSDKARDIELWLTEASGLTPQMISEFVFIGQQDFYAFLDANDAERSKKFTALCNTRIYERLRDEYNELLKIDQSRYEAASEASLEISKQSVAVAEQNLIDLNKVLAEIDIDIAALDYTRKTGQAEIDIANTTIKDVQEYGSILEDIKKETDRITTTKQEYEKNKGSLDRTNTELEKCISDLELAINGYGDDKKCLHALRQDLKIENDRKSLKANAEDLQDRIDAVSIPEPPEPEEIARAKENIALLNEDIVIETRNAKSKKILIDAMSQLGGDNIEDDAEDNVCSLCGADKQHWKVDLDNLQREYNEGIEDIHRSTKALNTEKQKLTQSEQLQSRYESALTKVQLLKDQLQDVNKHLAALPEQVSTPEEMTEDINYVSGLVSQKTLLQTNRESLESAMKSNQVFLDEANAEIDTLNKSSAALETIYPGLQESKTREQLIESSRATINTVTNVLNNLTDLETEQSGTKGRIQEAKRTLTDWKRKQEEQEALINGLGKTKVWFDHCAKAISWFKKDGLPRLIHRSILRQLTTIINAELELFGKPFSVEVNDDLTFTAIFDNGVRSNSRALSGGQKVMLAMSFWIAVNSTFAQNLGIMILDEPTDGLDPVNSACLYGILERLKKLLHQRGQQMVIITFDDEMTSVFDNVYRIVSTEET
jgi:DNA repair exonuclease SbcCD ATPase subunit